MATAEVGAKSAVPRIVSDELVELDGVMVLEEGEARVVEFRVV